MKEFDKALGADEPLAIPPEKSTSKPNAAAKDSRLTVATDLVCTVLLQSSGSRFAVREIEARARRAGLLSEKEKIGQSWLFRTIRKSLHIPVRREGFGPGSIWTWK